MMQLFLNNIRHLKPFYLKKQLVSLCLRTISSKNTQKSSIEANIELEDSDKPIEYLKSDAAKWKAHISRSGTVEKGPWYQSYVISISLAIFMIYFFILREENDMDLEFDKTLYHRISGLEEKNLEIVLKYNKERNLPTEDIENRLKEIRND